MTPAHHRQSARLLRLKGHPEKAVLHEQLTRASGGSRRRNSSRAKKALRERG